MKLTRRVFRWLAIAAGIAAPHIIGSARLRPTIKIGMCVPCGSAAEQGLWAQNGDACARCGHKAGAFSASSRSCVRTIRPQSSIVVGIVSKLPRIPDIFSFLGSIRSTQ